MCTSNCQHTSIVPLWQDLMADLHSELGGHLRTLVLALMEPKAIYDAQCLRNAMKGIGTNENVLIEILCTRANQVGIYWNNKINSTFLCAILYTGNQRYSGCIQNR